MKIFGLAMFLSLVSASPGFAGVRGPVATTLGCYAHVVQSRQIRDEAVNKCMKLPENEIEACVAAALLIFDAAIDSYPACKPIEKNLPL